jgi:hypothetical protein
MSTVQTALDKETSQQTEDALDRLIPTWQPVSIAKLRVDALYLFVTPSRRIFATYEGRQNGSLKVKTETQADVATVDVSSLQGVYKIGGDINVAEELNRRFSPADSKAI